tara:strand:+ start:362 stop:727 length:366 start_codon:yes stop_codon:yes gene_type:complete
MTETETDTDLLRQYICEESVVSYTCEEDMDKLIQELDDYGIETVEQFEDAYAGCFESQPCTSAEAMFCEELADDCGYMNETNLPNFIAYHIDWQAVWDCELRHDYFTIEADGDTYFFSRHF